ncbi:MAG: CoA transferase [Burkholderiaceae bacterium]
MITRPSHVQALDGITVLDFSHVIAGPFATWHLAALGAHVIKVEHPDGGDVMRARHEGFESINHGKEIIRLDLTRDADRARAHELLAGAQVMVDNMRPGVLEKFGLGAAEVRARRADLIHCRISGYGGQGDWGRRPAYDHVIQAASGMNFLPGDAGDGPIKVGFPLIDSVAGMVAALAIVSAIRRRDLTGEGDALDVSMLSAAMQAMYPSVVSTMASGQAPERIGNRAYSGSPGGGQFRCRDGLLAVAANTRAQLMRLAEALGLRDRIEPLLGGGDRAFVGGEHREQIVALLAARFADEDARVWEDRLNAMGVPAAKLRDLAEAVRDATEAGSLDPWTLPCDPPVRVPGLGFRAQNLFGPSGHGFGPDDAS